MSALPQRPEPPTAPEAGGRGPSTKLVQQRMVRALSSDVAKNAAVSVRAARKSSTPSNACSRSPALTRPGSAPVARTLSKEEMEAREADRQRLKKQHAENMQRAKDYAQKVAERDMKQREAREKDKAEAQRKQDDAYKKKKEALASLYRPSEEHPRTDAAPLAKRPCKRPSPSPKTVEVSRVMPVATPVATPVANATPKVRMVWNEDGLFGPVVHDEESMVDIAVREGPCEPFELDADSAANCIMNGTTMVAKEGAFVMNGLSVDPWMRTQPWADLISKINIEEFNGAVGDLILSGGLRAVKIGCGSFNLVVTVEPGQLPDFLGELRGLEVALRFTRPDKDRSNELRYQNLYSSRDEIANAVFASQNEIGVRLHSVCAFSAPRMARSIRYAIVMAMERATSDMRSQLCKHSTELQGAIMARSVTKLLFRASRCGVAFFDIKPGNVLCFDQVSRTVYRLTDYDPAFFVVTQNRDWRSLLLLNLALLSVHVRNFELCPANIGFLKAVAPLLKQLLRRREDYDSRWLFTTRSVRTLFKSPRDASDFELQRLMTSMCTSYFYGSHVASCISSTNHTWEKNHQKSLQAHWATPSNRTSWPADWSPRFTPLIVQMVEAALSGVKLD